MVFEDCTKGNIYTWNDSSTRSKAPLGDIKWRSPKAFGPEPKVLLSFPGRKENAIDKDC
jgi:hypothetical protein